MILKLENIVEENQNIYSKDFSKKKKIENFTGDRSTVLVASFW